MCGITGFFRPGSGSLGMSGADCVRGMADAMRHRGPDDSGEWADDTAGIAFGFRRLAIVDLSPQGHQPMISASGRTVMVFNGEVYNHKDLRRELQSAGIRFRSTSDSEVILEAFEHWGIEAAVRRMIGMFAIAVWDRRDRALSLVRDRVGIKPVYWGRAGGTVLFGSELKALRAHPHFTGALDRRAIAGFLRYNYVPAPLSIYEGIQKQRPGTILTFRDTTEPEEREFWSLNRVVADSLGNRHDAMSDADAEEGLDKLLRDAIGTRMIADVPLGAFLSGGIDSSTVVALMQAQSGKPVRTFSIGFHDPNFDEAVHAKDVARHLGTDHVELYVEPSHALDVIPRLPLIYDEPFADSSQIPTFLVSELTRRYVTVALSGDGGDEVFGGYNRYLLAESLGRWLRVPAFLRRATAAAIEAIPPAMFDAAARLVPGRRQRVGDKLHKLAGVMTANSADMLYDRLTTFWPEAPRLAIGGGDPRNYFDERFASTIADQTEREQYLDSMTYLPDDILAKVDRASMAVSLEARVPLLDHRVIEFAWRLQPNQRIRDGSTKWLLRRVLDRYVPSRLIDRPKMGFGVPLDAWLRGPLRPWAEALLDERRLRQEGFLEPAPIRKKWLEHLSGTRNWQYALWGVLMFQAWLESERAASRRPAAA